MYSMLIASPSFAIKHPQFNVSTVNNICCMIYPLLITSPVYVSAMITFAVFAVKYSLYETTNLSNNVIFSLFIKGNQ